MKEGLAMQIISKLINLIFLDVKSENETKKVSVILRVNSMLMSLYFVSLAIVFGVTGYGKFILICIFCFLAYILSFYLTYMDRTKFAAAFAQVLNLVCILGFVYEFGWDCGIQHFIFTLLGLVFVTSHTNMRGKIIIAIGLCTVRLGLFFYTRYTMPEFLLQESTIVAMQITNTIYIFMTMTSALAFFSKDSTEMEKKLIQYNEKMHHLASVDPLTGLCNRRSMEEYLDNQEKQYKSGNGVCIAVAIGDIDFFKKINDTYGHDCGDAVLKNLSELFAQHMEDKGKVCRWGGEEFLFAFYDYNGDDAFIILDSILTKVRMNSIEYKGQQIKITVTFGLEEINFRKGVEYGINEADNKLYIGKKAGRDRIIY